MIPQEIIESIRGKVIKAIRLNAEENVFEIKLDDGSIIKIETDCKYDNYHKLSINVIGDKPDTWIS